MLLTQNREMRADGVWNWTLPAWVTTLSNGNVMNVCPSAGACAEVCYARNGTFRFPMVQAKHRRNLEMVLDGSWFGEMERELSGKKFLPSGRPRTVPGLASTEHLSVEVRHWLASGGQAVRIHDSGDFFTSAYLLEWLTLSAMFPSVLFYFYTKELSLMREWSVSPQWPANVLWVYSLGGRQDKLLDRDAERHADVFPDVAAIEAAGYMSQHESDLLAVLLPTTRIGIPQNNIPQFRRRLGGRTFSQAQSDRHAS